MTLSVRSNLNADYSYYNFSLFNNTGRPIVASFQEDRVIPIIQNSQDFQVACVRFKIPSASIPLFRFEENEYLIGMRVEADPVASLLVDTVLYDQTLVSSNREDFDEKFIWSYTQFLDMLNKSLDNLWTLALASPSYVGGGTEPLNNLTGSAPPYFKLDPSGSHLIFVLPGQEQTVPAPAVFPYTNFFPAYKTLSLFGQNISFFISPKLQYLLSGFPTRGDEIGTLFYNPAQPKLTFQLLVSVDIKTAKLTEQSAVLNALVSPADRQYYWEWYQDYAALYLWYSLSRILLSTSMPLEQESVGSFDTGGQPLAQRVLTDFEIPSDRTPALRDYIEFQPSSDFRYTNFQTNGDLRKIDLKISYQDNTLRTYDLKLLPGTGCNIKIQFKRRKAKNLLQYSA